VRPAPPKILENYDLAWRALYVAYTLEKAITMTLLTKDQICAELGISPRGLENMISRGEFPPPTRLGKRNRWTDQALQAWRQRFFHAQEMWMPGNA
jgi:predicted DNA-binding transcriptional regulator AlpA